MSLKQYQILVAEIEDCDFEPLYNELDRWAFISSYNWQEKYFDVSWDLDKPITDVISFPNTVKVIQIL